MIRIDEIWLATKPLDMRAGPDTAVLVKSEQTRSQATAASLTSLQVAQVEPATSWPVPSLLHRGATAIPPAAIHHTPRLHPHSIVPQQCLPERALGLPLIDAARPCERIGARPVCSVPSHEIALCNIEMLRRLIESDTAAAFESFICLSVIARCFWKGLCVSS